MIDVGDVEFADKAFKEGLIENIANNVVHFHRQFGGQGFDIHADDVGAVRVIVCEFFHESLPNFASRTRSCCMITNAAADSNSRSWFAQNP